MKNSTDRYCKTAPKPQTVTFTINCSPLALDDNGNEDAGVDADADTFKKFRDVVEVAPCCAFGPSTFSVMLREVSSAAVLDFLLIPVWR